MDHSPRFLALCEEARSQVKECSIAEVRARVDAKETFNLVDVREESEFGAGHIPGARHLGKGIIERDVERRFRIPRQRSSSTAEAAFAPRSQPWR